MMGTAFEIRDVRIYGTGEPETIGIRDGKICHVSQPRGKCRSINGRGLTAIPGAIDGHVHFRHFGERDKEDWLHASRAAWKGGVTTVLDMGNHPAPHAVTTFEAYYAKLRALTKLRDIVDHRLWFIATPGNVHEFREIRRHPFLSSGLAGIKLYMESTTGGLLVDKAADQLEWCQVAADTGTLIAAHVGDEEMIQKNRRRHPRPTVADHCVIRDTNVELSGGCQFLEHLASSGAQGEIKHVSTPELVVEAMKARNRGVSVSLEICPHHWLKTARDLLGEAGGFHKMNPPLRTLDQVVMMRRYVSNGVIDSIATDHAPHTRAAKHSRRYDDVPSGVPGVQEMLPLAFMLVQQNLLSLSRLIDLTARNPASLYGLKNKGRLEVGCDADIVLIDVSSSTPFTEAEVESKCGWSIYKDVPVCRPLLVVERGRVRVNNLGEHPQSQAS